MKSKEKGEKRMASLNKVTLIGHLVGTPELKQTPSGVAVTSFSIGINRKFTSGGKTETDFINIVAWRSTAEFICKYFQKGNAIGICGSIQSRTWEDRGVKKYATEVVAEEAFFIERKEAGGATYYDVPEDDMLPWKE
jgi:single-strand DNA-binding protein